MKISDQVREIIGLPGAAPEPLCLLAAVRRPVGSPAAHSRPTIDISRLEDCRPVVRATKWSSCQVTVARWYSSRTASGRIVVPERNAHARPQHLRRRRRASAARAGRTPRTSPATRPGNPGRPNASLPSAVVANVSGLPGLNDTRPNWIVAISSSSGLIRSRVPIDTPPEVISTSAAARPCAHGALERRPRRRSAWACQTTRRRLLRRPPSARSDCCRAPTRAAASDAARPARRPWPAPPRAAAGTPAPERSRPSPAGRLRPAPIRLPGGQHVLAAGQVHARRMDVFAAPRPMLQHGAAVRLLDLLDHDHRVGAGRQRAARHDAHRGAWPHLGLRQPPGGDFFEDVEFRRVVAGHDRVAVDRRARQARQVGVGQDVLRPGCGRARAADRRVSWPSGWAGPGSSPAPRRPGPSGRRKRAACASASALSAAGAAAAVSLAIRHSKNWFISILATPGSMRWPTPASMPPTWPSPSTWTLRALAVGCQR